MEQNKFKWDPYVLIKNNDILKFWKNFLNRKEKTLIIIAKGFDPRMVSFAENLQEEFHEHIEFLILNIEDEDGPYHKLTEKNWARLKIILTKKSIHYKLHDVEMWQPKQNSKTRVGPNNVIDLINDGALGEFKNIVVDISSMPRVIYFSLITSILDISKFRNENDNIMNVLINVVEHPELDGSIQSTGVDEKAEFIPGLGGNFQLESDLLDLEGSKKPKIWLPILGEKQKIKLIEIENLVQSDEICPVLPFPSERPRRTDDLLLEYREILFDKWFVEKENIIYASETNPFELYRHLNKTIRRYFNALKPIGGCKIAISSLSSKLLSIGALLTAYEMYRIENKSVGLIHLGGSQYNIDDKILENYSKENENLITLWIDGEPYKKI